MLSDLVKNQIWLQNHTKWFESNKTTDCMVTSAATDFANITDRSIRISVYHLSSKLTNTTKGGQTYGDSWKTESGLKYKETEEKQVPSYGN